MSGRGWIESVQRIALPKYTVRVWREQDDCYDHVPGLYSDVEAVARAHQDASPAELARKIAVLPSVVAVEVLDWDHGGVMFYSEWPEV